MSTATTNVGNGRDPRSWPQTSPAHRDQTRSQTTSRAKSGWVTIALLIYIVLAIFSWVIPSIQSFRPITRGSYSWVTLSDSYLRGNSEDGLFVQNDQLYQASRIITAILAVATVPLVLILCSGAKGSYIRRNRQNMRQAIVIIDERNGPYLFFTLSMCFLGALIFILQLVLVSSQLIYTPNRIITTYDYSNGVFDIPSGIDGGPLQEDLSDTVIIAAALKGSLSTVAGEDLLPTLWQDNITCATRANGPTTYNGDRVSLCAVGGNNLQNLSSLSGPFISAQPYAYNTGLISQFLPRLNSSSTYEQVSSFPSCNGANSWSRSYFNSSTTPGYNDTRTFAFQVCMPDTSSTFKNIRARQDMNETLYLKLSSTSAGNYGTTQPLYTDYTVKITLNTTSGYFEPPNSMNQQQPGPLIAGSPIDACGDDCYPQTWNQYLTLGRPINYVGPLFRIAEALFGNQSILDTLLQNPQGYRIPGLDLSNTLDIPDSVLSTCVQLFPLARLMESQHRPDFIYSSPCIRYYDRPMDNAVGWMINFVNNTENMKSTFDAAAAIANDIWLNSRTNGYTYDISRDFGTQHLKAVIPLPALIVISILLLVFLAGLVFIAVYGRLDRSSNNLNSLFMVRLGAMNYRRLGDPNPAVVDAALDEIPGWVEEDKVTITDDMELN